MVAGCENLLAAAGGAAAAPGLPQSPAPPAREHGDAADS